MRFLLSVFLFCTLFAAVRADEEISADEMQAIFDEVKTSFKYGVLLQPEQGQYLDCPNVFRHGDAWYMVYVAITDKVGYETCLARSENLLDWKPLGKILPFAEDGWDKWQADGSIALVDPTWGGSAEIQPVRRQVLDVVLRRSETRLRNRSHFPSAWPGPLSRTYRCLGIALPRTRC